MAAYSAVLSLLLIIDHILHPRDRPRISHNKAQLKSLREKLCFLLNFLESSSSPKASNLSALESLETKIREAAYTTEDILESRVSNQLLAEPETQGFGKPARISNAFVAVNLLMFIVFGRLIQVCIQKVIGFSIQICMPVINMTPLRVRILVPFYLQTSVFFVVQILIPLVVRILLPVFVLCLISVWVPFLIYKAVVKVVSFAAKHGFQPHDRDLRQVMDDLDFIIKEVVMIEDSFGAGQDLPQSNVLSAASSSRLDSSGIGKKLVFGLERDLTEIKTQLISDSPKIKVVSVVGMGGIGKTTLAREVFDDSYTDYYFDVRAWVTVSQEYSVRHVLLSLLSSAKILTKDMSEDISEVLAEYLYKSLKGRRYLIVMDDMWDTEIWDAVRRFFPEDNNGSCVLLTTRLSNVALYANSDIPLHRMHFLNEDESWNLLCAKVFGEEDCPDDLEEIGKEIARTCKGLPLEIVVIGGLLSKVSRTEEYWKSIADNLNSIVTKDDEHCMEVLSLSYNHLPYHLRSCFLYMGVFPEDFEIPVPRLTRLWVAEGFVKPDKAKSLEALAEKYLVDLIERNLILACKWGSDGKIRKCNIHDLVRNLCLQNAQKEDFLYVVKCHDDVLQEGTNIPRRLSIHPDTLSIQPDILSIQSEILYNSEIRKSSGRSLLCTDTCSSQDSETCLLLPMEIRMMPELRHICSVPSIFPDPPGAGFLSVLENLQTLVEAKNFRCSKDILERIPNIRKLVISYDLHSSVDWSEYQLDALVNLYQLHTLKLFMHESLYAPEIVNRPKLAFPQKLKKLTLSGCHIPWESMTIIGALPNLEVLKLLCYACQGTEWEPVEGEFRQLKYLLLESQYDLVHWIANETHFPNLQCLSIRYCVLLEEIPSDIGEISTLRMIELIDCPPSVVTSAKQIQEEQVDMGNEDLKVRVGGWQDVKARL
ncbi:UNVERIFIED_CONTAM: putative late blight resistance proteinR1A-10 [Sesamum radiatum]|uniref:Late blight resistance proteinR1A-10 n=1 Tax=Sesamum radiatum TaxID=300843 RepID=A0AAW2PIQ9_SESRA